MLIWFVFIGVALMVLATLNILPSQDITAISSQLFGMDITHGMGFLMMSMLLLGCAFLCFKFNQFYPKSIFIRMGQIFVQILFIGFIILLFMLDTISTEKAFLSTVHAIPEHGYIINAKVTVHNVSDGVYDTGSYYRQKATLSELTFDNNRPMMTGLNKDNKNKQKQTQKQTQSDNPFATTTHTPTFHPSLPTQMTVLLHVAKC